MTQQELNNKSIMERLIAGYILERETAGLIGMSLRHIQRIKKRFKSEGDLGLIHRARGRPSNHHIDPSRYDTAVSIISSEYADYSYTLIHEKLRDKHGISLSMPTIRSELIRRGIRTPRRQKKPDIQRTMRERKEYAGEMEQYDGSYHNWFEGRGGIREACLLVAVDDANKRVIAKFDHSEGISPIFRFWREYIFGSDGDLDPGISSEKGGSGVPGEKGGSGVPGERGFLGFPGFGKPHSIYLDHFSTYKVNHPNATDDKDPKTQFGRVCQALGITLIFANSPQGKGRVERMNATLQDRLVKELREVGIPHTTDFEKALEEANIFLRDIFLPRFNTQFMVVPRGEADLHMALRDDEKTRVDALFSEQKLRKIHNDFTVRFEGKIFQIYRSKQGGSLVYHGYPVIIEKRMNGSIYIRNKNGNYLITRELDELPKRSSHLPLPPLTSEDAYTTKLKYMAQLQEERLTKQQAENRVKQEERIRLSLLKQEFYKTHRQGMKFDVSWQPTLT